MTQTKEARRKYREENREKIRTYKVWYESTPEFKARRREYRRTLKQENRKKMIWWFGGKCENCGTTSQLEFHHRVPELKCFKISSVKFINSKVIDELEKCDLLCKTCHDNIHCGGLV